MSVQSNITRIEGGKASLKTSINNKLNSTQQKITNEHIEDYHLFVDQISGGGGVGTLEIYENGVYDVSDYANVYVKITELVPCTSISFNKSESTILPDETDTIIATYTPTETTDAIVWNSDNVTVATVTRVAGTDSAVITYVGAGTCHITATCGSFSVSCTVTCDSGEIHCTSITLDQHTLTLDEPVQEKPCTAITLDKSTVSVGTGETVTVTATLTPSDTTDTLTVTSSDTTKATVTLSGNVATITGVADGSSNITFNCGDISEVCACTISASVPVSSVKVSGQYNKLLLGDIDGTKQIGIMVVPSPTNTTVDKSTAVITPDDSSIVIYNGDCSGSASSAFNYYLIPQHKAGSTTFTFSLDGKSDSGTRTVEIVDKASYDDGELIKTEQYSMISANYTNHIGQYSKSTAYKTFIYKVTAGNNYLLSGTQHSGTAITSVHVLGDWSPYTGDLSDKYPLIGDSALFRDDDQTQHTINQTLTMPTGASYVCVITSRLSDLSLSPLTAMTKISAIVKEVNITLDDAFHEQCDFSPTSANEPITFTNGDDTVISVETDGKYVEITPKALGTSVITITPAVTTTLSTTSTINVVESISDGMMMGSYRQKHWSRNASTGKLGYNTTAKMMGYVFKVTPGDSYTVTYTKGDATHDLHICSCDYMQYSTGASGGGGPAQNSTELVIEQYPVTVLSHTVTIPAGQPYLFVSFIDSAEVTLTKN